MGAYEIFLLIVFFGLTIAVAYSIGSGLGENMNEHMKPSCDSHVPAVKKTRNGKILWGIGIAALLAGVIGIANRNAQASEDAYHLQNLETYLQKQDFDAIITYIGDVKESEPGYEKYFEVKAAYQPLANAEHVLGLYYEALKEDNPPEVSCTFYVATTIAECFNSILKVDSFLSDSLIQENESALEEIRLEAENILTILSLTDEEMQELRELEVSTYTADEVTSYAELARGRME